MSRSIGHTPLAAESTLSIALIGTRGVPARYGGFETCVEEVGARLADRGHRVTTYCRSSDPADRALREYRGMTLVHLPALRRRSLETLSHTGLSVGHQLFRRADVALVFNSANAPFLPVLRARGIPVATHVDGLEWKRTKWSGNGQKYYRWAERTAVRFSQALIADARGIADYYRETHHSDTDLIAYGAPTVGSDSSRLAELSLTRHGYHLVVARFEPENHVLEIVQGHAASSSPLPLVVVGSAPYSDDYTAEVHAAGDPQRVRFLGGVWDQGLLDQLYAGAHTYLHGHSVGGTNPSLLRAIGAGTATIAHDVVFNREVLEDAGRYFTGAAGAAAEIDALIGDDLALQRMRSLAGDRAALYTWDDVADRYEALCLRLAASKRRVKVSS